MDEMQTHDQSEAGLTRDHSTLVGRGEEGLREEGRGALFSYKALAIDLHHYTVLHLTPKGREAVVESISSTRNTKTTQTKTENDSAHSLTT